MVAFEVKVLLGIYWFVVDICDDFAVYVFYKDVYKCQFFWGVFHSKFYFGV